MIDENKLFTALTNIISSPRTTKLLKSLILPNGNGEYLLFGIYVINYIQLAYLHILF